MVVRRPELTKVNIPAQAVPSYNGLKTSFFNLDAQGNKHFVVKGTNNNMNVPIHDPHEEFNHVNKQIFGSENTPIASLSQQWEDFIRILHLMMIKLNK